MVARKAAKLENSCRNFSETSFGINGRKIGKCKTILFVYRLTKISGSGIGYVRF